MNRAMWVLLYTLLCGVEFLVGWAKDHASEKIKGKTDKPGDA